MPITVYEVAVKCEVLIPSTAPVKSVVPGVFELVIPEANLNPAPP